ncbi:MAG: phosphotransferase [Firmicutes bacterium]|nr:phosphotransferase [Bacillota bacterium]
MNSWFDASVRETVERVWGLTVVAELPLRSVVGLLTDRGRLIVKLHTGQPARVEQRLAALAAVRLQLERMGVCTAPLLTLHGAASHPGGGGRLAVEPWLRGQHADFRAASDQCAAARAIARLHCARPSIPFALDQAPTLLQKLASRLSSADQVVANGRLRGIGVDRWRRFRRLAESALRAAMESPGAAAIRANRLHNPFCHRDLAPHNILVRAGEPAQLIDFDLAGQDDACADVYQLLTHIRYWVPTDRAVSSRVLDAYESVRPLEEGSIDLLERLCPYPAILLREVAELRFARDAVARQRAARRVAYAATVEEERMRAASCYTGRVC